MRGRHAANGCARFCFVGAPVVARRRLVARAVVAVRIRARQQAESMVVSFQSYFGWLSLGRLKLDPIFLVTPSIDVDVVLARWTVSRLRFFELVVAAVAALAVAVAAGPFATLEALDTLSATLGFSLSASLCAENSASTVTRSAVSSWLSLVCLAESLAESGFHTDASSLPSTSTSMDFFTVFLAGAL